MRIDFSHQMLHQICLAPEKFHLTSIFSAFVVITRKVYYFKPVIIIPSCLTLMEFFFKGTRALFRELDNIELDYHSLRRDLKNVSIRYISVIPFRNYK